MKKIFIYLVIMMFPILAHADNDLQSDSTHNEESTAVELAKDNLDQVAGARSAEQSSPRSDSNNDNTTQKEALSETSGLLSNSKEQGGH